MAKILNGILGGFSRKVGTVIGACWKGIDYMRALATSLTTPRIPAQLAQRSRFSLVVLFLRPLIIVQFAVLNWSVNQSDQLQNTVDES